MGDGRVRWTFWQRTGKLVLELVLSFISTRISFPKFLLPFLLSHIRKFGEVGGRKGNEEEALKFW